VYILLLVSLGNNELNFPSIIVLALNGMFFIFLYINEQVNLNIDDYSNYNINITYFYNEEIKEKYLNFILKILFFLTKMELTIIRRFNLYHSENLV
jgi:hypothetical protein